MIADSKWRMKSDREAKRGVRMILQKFIRYPHWYRAEVDVKKV